MNIKLPYENLELLNTWPKLTLERYQKVFELIEAELPNVFETETFNITISDEQFIKAGVIDFSNTLMGWEEKIGLIHCNYVPKKKELGGYTEISILTNELDKFLKVGNALKKRERETEYKNGVLYFMGKEIDFRNKQNQKDLLTTLFKDSSKNWSYDEIQEDWDEVGVDKEKYPKDYWRKFYSAGDDINTAVAKKIQIEDFIIKNTKEIRINPKHT